MKSHRFALQHGQRSKTTSKTTWSNEDDAKLAKLVAKYGVGKWRDIAQYFQGRIGKQCRERWHNNLKSGINKGCWSKEEDLQLIAAHQEVGNKWSEIAKRIPGRTENGVKNRWNATKRRKDQGEFDELKQYILRVDSIPGHPSKTERKHGRTKPRKRARRAMSSSQSSDDDTCSTDGGGLSSVATQQTVRVTRSSLRRSLRRRQAAVKANFSYDSQACTGSQFSFDLTSQRSSGCSSDSGNSGGPTEVEGALSATATSTADQSVERLETKIGNVSSSSHASASAMGCNMQWEALELPDCQQDDFMPEEGVQLDRRGSNSPLAVDSHADYAQEDSRLVKCDEGDVLPFLIMSPLLDMGPIDLPGGYFDTDEQCCIQQMLGIHEEVWRSQMAHQQLVNTTPSPPLLQTDSCPAVPAMPPKQPGRPTSLYQQSYAHLMCNENLGPPHGALQSEVPSFSCSPSVGSPGGPATPGLKPTTPSGLSSAPLSWTPRQRHTLHSVLQATESPGELLGMGMSRVPTHTQAPLPRVQSFDSSMLRSPSRPLGLRQMSLPLVCTLGGSPSLPETRLQDYMAAIQENMAGDVRRPIAGQDANCLKARDARILARTTFPMDDIVMVQKLPISHELLCSQLQWLPPTANLWFTMQYGTWTNRWGQGLPAQPTYEIKVREYIIQHMLPNLRRFLPKQCRVVVLVRLGFNADKECRLYMCATLPEEDTPLAQHWAACLDAAVLDLTNFVEGLQRFD